MKGIVPLAIAVPILGGVLVLRARKEPEPYAAVAFVATPGAELRKSIGELRGVLAERLRERDRHTDAALADLLARLAANPFERWPERDRELLLDGVQSLLEAPVKLDASQRRACASAARVLGSLGPRGAPLLKQAYLHPRFDYREEGDLRAEFLRNLGRTQDASMAPFLLEQAIRRNDETVIAAAGEALGNFVHLPLETRRPIVKELIQRMECVFAAASSSADPNDPRAEDGRKTWSAIFAPWNAALAALTRQGTNVPGDWGAWWATNGARDWDASTESR